MIKGGLVLIWELHMNLVLTLLYRDKWVYHFYLGCTFLQARTFFKILFYLAKYIHIHVKLILDQWIRSYFYFVSIVQKSNCNSHFKVVVSNKQGVLKSLDYTEEVQLKLLLYSAHFQIKFNWTHFKIVQKNKKLK